MKVKVGVIGAGRQGGVHLQRYSALKENVEIVAVCDPDQNALNRAAENFNIEKQYSDYTRLLEEELDAVSICAPNKYHRLMAVAAAEAGKNILLEKPIAFDLEDADAIVSAAEKGNVKLMVAYDQLFNPIVQKVRSLIDNGELGKLSVGNFEWYNNFSHRSRSDFGWRADIDKAGGGSLMESGIHKISMLYYLMGGVNSVFAFAKRLIMDIDGEDNVKLMTNHKSGAIGSVTCSWTSEIKGPEQERFSIYGSKGSVLACGSFHVGTGHLEFSSTSEGEHGRTHYWYPPVRSSRTVYDSYMNEINHFLDCILNDKTPIVSGHDARAIQEIVAAAYESVDKQSMVTLPLKHQ